MTDEATVAPPEVVAENGALAAGRRAAAASLLVLRIGHAALRRLFDQRDAWNRRLVVALGLVAGVACLIGVPELIGVFPAGIDFEIPMRAAAHWSSGAPVYPPSAMFVQSGPDLPYLYPPFLLPLLAPIAAMPRPTVTGLWLIFCILCAIWTCRRLAIPWLAVPFVLAWPPFAEGLITGNSQILAFAAFVAFLYEPIGGELRPKELCSARDALNGVLAAAVGALKATQLLPVLYLARRRFRAAAIGVVALGAVAAVMLPWTGVSIYGDWLAQLERAADPSWTTGGVAVGRLLHIPDLALAAAGIAIALAARGRDAGAWLGIALLIATPSVHGYTFLFLLPGLLTIRRDYAILLSTLFLGVYHAIAWWIAFVMVVYLLLASTRWTWLRRPDDGVRDVAAADPEPTALEVAPA
jgi:Glycosyltransferase family 87